MKYNKIVKESDIKNKNTFLVACVCSVVLLLTLCYFGVNGTVKGTQAASTCTCDQGTLSGTTCLITNSSTKVSGWNCTEIVAGQFAGKWNCQKPATCEEDKENKDDDDVPTTTSCSSYNGNESACKAAGCNYVAYSGVCGGSAPSTPTSCSAGKYLSNGKCLSCPGNKYCPGGTSQPQSCPSDKPNAPANSTSVADCYKIEQSSCSSYSGNESACKAAGCNYVAYSGVCNGSASGENETKYCWNVGTSQGNAYQWGTESQYGSDRYNKVDACYCNNSCGGSEEATWNCNPGYYSAGQNYCRICTAGYYCPGGTFKEVSNSSAGLIKCPSGKTSPAQSDDVNDCYDTSVGDGPSNPGGNPSVPDDEPDNPSGGGQGGPTDDEKILVATFNPNGGILNGKDKESCSTSGTSCYITNIPTASKDGYTFNGWGETSSCTSGSKSSVKIDKNTTFYACYSGNSGNNGGNVTENPTTGEVVIALVWFAGIFAIAYSVFYFKQVKQN